VRAVRHFEEREKQLMADVATARHEVAELTRLLDEQRAAQRATLLRIQEVRL
jgi:hypothetical protein